MSDLTHQMLDEKINISNLSNLSKEGMAAMDVFKNMSHRFIEKDEWLISGVMSAASPADYPLDWTQIPSGIPLYSSVATTDLTSDANFGGNRVAKGQMSYVKVDTAKDFTIDQLKRLNVLNNVWKKINLVKLGYEFDVDVTSTFFMIKDITTNTEIIATIPGQNVVAKSFSSYDFYTQAMTNTTNYFPITLREDPFLTGIPKVVGYCKGFKISVGSTPTYEGVIGIFYNSKLMENLLLPIAKKADSVTFALYQVTSAGDVLLASTDKDNVISGNGNVRSILTLQTPENVLIQRDVVKSGENYQLRASSKVSKSGATHKAIGIYGPYYKKASYSEYNFRAIFLQNNDVLVKFSENMRQDIQKEFALVYSLLPVFCIFFCFVVGLILYLCVLRPIKELTKAAKGK